MRLRLRGWLLLCALVRSRAQSPETRWTEWVSGDKAANAHERTRAELQAFSAQCFQMAPYWAAVADVHESLSSVVVFDVRHNWNGLGDSHERLNFILRVGRKLNRASFLWANGASAEAPGQRVTQRCTRWCCSRNARSCAQARQQLRGGTQTGRRCWATPSARCARVTRRVCSTRGRSSPALAESGGSGRPTS